jgi:hypothetical protein
MFDFRFEIFHSVLFYFFSLKFHNVAEHTNTHTYSGDVRNNVNKKFAQEKTRKKDYSSVVV